MFLCVGRIICFSVVRLFSFTDAENLVTPAFRPFKKSSRDLKAGGFTK